MNDNNRATGMGRLADEAAKETNRTLRGEELKLLLNTTIDLKSLRPQMADQETYDKLIEAIEDASRHNNDIAMLKRRTSQLGKAGVVLVKKVISLI